MFCVNILQMACDKNINPVLSMIVTSRKGKLMYTGTQEVGRAEAQRVNVYERT